MIETRAAFVAGPDVPDAELRARRSALTNALGDLLDADELVERTTQAARVSQLLGEFVLLSSG